MFSQGHLPDLKVHAYFAPLTPPPSAVGGRPRYCRCCVILWRFEHCSISACILMDNISLFSYPSDDVIYAPYAWILKNVSSNFFIEELPILWLMCKHLNLFSKFMHFYDFIYHVYEQLIRNSFEELKWMNK